MKFKFFSTPAHKYNAIVWALGIVGLITATVGAATEDEGISGPSMIGWSMVFTAVSMMSVKTLWIICHGDPSSANEFKYTGDPSSICAPPGFAPFAVSCHKDLQANETDYLIQYRL